jgi:hypothetical protein
MSTAVFVRKQDAREVKNELGVINRYYVGSRGEEPGPQGWLIDFPAGRRVNLHFHDVDQFQVFFPSPGSTFRRHEMEPLVVHYADAYSTYGPIVAGPTDMHFTTLRAQGSRFVAYLPKERDKLVKKGKRNYHVGLEGWLSEPLPAEGEALMKPLFKPQSDNMAIYTVAAGRGARFEGPSPRQSSGQYYCVVGGTFDDGAQQLERMTVAWRSPDDDLPALVAGPEGGRLLVMQFPAPLTA